MEFQDFSIRKALPEHPFNTQIKTSKNQELYEALKGDWKWRY